MVGSSYQSMRAFILLDDDGFQLVCPHAIDDEA
jgi:hypothetical protein